MTNYTAIGIKPIINATGNFTSLGGSIMPPEVVAAWVEASMQFVDLLELQDRVGERIAKLVGAPAALVTTGAAGAIVLGTAAAVTGGDPALIRRLPQTSGLRNEVILQRTHHSGYDSQLTNVGVTLVDVETLEDLQRAINPRTALMFFMNDADGEGKIKRADWIAAARQYNVPTLVDASADVPPVARLRDYCVGRGAFDLVAISGGKAIRGPNDTGLLLGRTDLIEAAKRNTNPNEPSLGRMMKVGKEDMMALLTAIERFLRLDHQAERNEMERRVTVIETAVSDIAGVTTEHVIPPIANHQPHLIVDWDRAQISLSPEQVTDALKACDPSIRIGRVTGTGQKGILISVLALQPGEEQIVAFQLRRILSSQA